MITWLILAFLVGVIAGLIMGARGAAHLVTERFAKYTEAAQEAGADGRAWVAAVRSRNLDYGILSDFDFDAS